MFLPYLLLPLTSSHRNILTNLHHLSFPDSTLCSTLTKYLLFLYLPFSTFLSLSELYLICTCFRTLSLQTLRDSFSISQNHSTSCVRSIHYCWNHIPFIYCFFYYFSDMDSLLHTLRKAPTLSLLLLGYFLLISTIFKFSLLLYFFYFTFTIISSFSFMLKSTFYSF